MNKFIIPATCLAEDDAALRQKREELKAKLLAGKKVSISPTGNVTGGEKDGGMFIPQGKLAEDDAALRQKREELKAKLLAGKKVSISPTGNVTGGDKEGGMFIPQGKLAALAQWYEKDPILLEAEKAAMHKYFPHFTLDKLDDGRLYWAGALNVGVIGDREWNIMAVYDNNHPNQVMGSSVKIYLVEPDIDEVIADLGWRPFHLLRDSNNNQYLCTAEAGNIKTGRESTSAASVIAWAVKWLMSLELVLTGNLTKEQFNTHGVI